MLQYIATISENTSTIQPGLDFDYDNVMLYVFIHIYLCVYVCYHFYGYTICIRYYQYVLHMISLYLSSTRNEIYVQD